MASSTTHRETIGRRELVAMVSMTIALTALAIDIMLPAFPEVRQAFGLASDATEVSGIITTFFLGLAVGMLFYGTLADRFGRKPILYLGFTIYGIGAIGSALAPTLDLILLARFVWGFGAAGSRTLGLAIVRDLYEGDRMARVMSYVMAIFILVPIVAPAIGALIVAVAPWRFVFWFCVLFVAAMALWVTRLPETLHPEYRIAITVRDVRRAVTRVVKTRQTVGFTFVLTAIFGVFLSFLGSSQIIVADVYDLEPWFPLIFGAMAAVNGITLLLNARLVAWWGARRVAHRAMVGYVIAAAVMFTLALVTAGRPPLLLFLVSLGALLAMFSLIVPNLNTLAMQPVGDVAGTAAAFVGFISTAGAAMLGAMIDAAFDGTVTPLAVGFALSALASIVLLLWTERMRLSLRRDGVQVS